MMIAGRRLGYWLRRSLSSSGLVRSTCGVTRGPQDVGYGAEACIGLRWRSVADVDRTPNNEPGRFEPGCLFLRRICDDGWLTHLKRRFAYVAVVGAQSRAHGAGDELGLPDVAPRWWSRGWAIPCV